MERYTADTKYELVWRRNSLIGKVVQVPRATSGITVIVGEVDPDEDINYQTYSGAGDIYFDAIYAPQAYGVPKDDIRQE